MPKDARAQIAQNSWTGGGERRVLPPQLERVRLERPSRARPKDITQIHKAPRGRLRDLRGCQNSPPVSSPQIPLYRRGMSRVSLIAQHFVRLRRPKCCHFPKPSILMRSSGTWYTPPQDAVEASLDNPLDETLLIMGGALPRPESSFTECHNQRVR